jgi:hypothetical protein
VSAYSIAATGDPRADVDLCCPLAAMGNCPKAGKMPSAVTTMLSDRTSDHGVADSVSILAHATTLRGDVLCDFRRLCVRPSHRVGTILDMSSVEHRDEEDRLHLFTVDDPRLWEFRSRLTDQEFAIPDISGEDWDSFHAIIAEA